MNLYIYSDESGVFDKKHNKYFVYAGLVFFGKDNKDIACRKYHKVEKDIRNIIKCNKNIELKASFLKNKYKNKVFRSLNNEYKFAAIIELENIIGDVFEQASFKQRFMDNVYKLVVRHAIEKYMQDKNIPKVSIENIRFFVDEHTTKNGGVYDLKEIIKQEYIKGVYNSKFTQFIQPILPNSKELFLNYCDSKVTPMVRASDIIANKVYYLLVNNKKDELENIKNLYIEFLPQQI